MGSSASSNRRVRVRLELGFQCREILTPVRSRAIHVGEVVHLAESPTRERLTCEPRVVRIGCECGDGPPNEMRCLAEGKVWIFCGSIFPVLFGHAKMLEHFLAAQKPWCECGNGEMRGGFARRVQEFEP
jgi:hypothetical protein